MLVFIEPQMHVFKQEEPEPYNSSGRLSFPSKKEPTARGTGSARGVVWFRGMTLVDGGKLGYTIK